jgi:hypothetical protein
MILGRLNQNFPLEAIHSSTHAEQQVSFCAPNDIFTKKCSQSTANTDRMVLDQVTIQKLEGMTCLAIGPSTWLMRCGICSGDGPLLETCEFLRRINTTNLPYVLLAATVP